MKAQTILWYLGFSLLLADYIHTVRVIQFTPTSSEIASVDLSPDRIPSYDSLKKIISKTTYSKVLHISGTRFEISVPGFPVGDLDSLITENNKRPLHEMQRLALYSVAYGREMISIYDSTHDVSILESLSRFTRNTLEHVNSFSFVPDVMRYNDHVVSDRVGFLMLWYKKLSEKHIFPEDWIMLLDQMRRDILCLWRNDRFMWRTNHGLLQVRALFDIASVLNESPAGTVSRMIAYERLSDIIPFFVNPDGAILEGASSYWIFIFNEFNKIRAADSMPDSLAIVLDETIDHMQQFLQSVVSKDGTLMQIGDSHAITNLNQFTLNKRRSTVQLYSNGLVSGHLTKDSSDAQLLFVSVDTPPNIHKLPEDLALFVQYNGMSLFAGPGIYSYDNSKEQKYIRSEASQSTVTMGTESKPDSSRIISIELNDDHLRFNGKKWYKNIEICRTIYYCLTNGVLTINDSSTSMLFSRYTLNPELRIVHWSDSVFSLHWNSDSIRCTYSGFATTKDSYIAQTFHQLVPAKQIEIRGKTTLSIHLAKLAQAKVDTVVQGQQLRTNRQQKEKLLEQKYQINENISRFSYNRLFIGRIGVALVILLMIFYRNSSNRKIRIIWNIAFSVICLALVFDMHLDGTLLSLYFLK